MTHQPEQEKAEVREYPLNELEALSNEELQAVSGGISLGSKVALGVTGATVAATAIGVGVGFGIRNSSKKKDSSSGVGSSQGDNDPAGG
jgi:bacteriocin-like protein